MHRLLLKFSHTHQIETSMFFSIRHLLLSESVYIWSEEKKNFCISLISGEVSDQTFLVALILGNKDCN